MAAIGESEVKKIASCKDHEGRCALAQLLSLGPYEDECNMGKAMKVDFYYDSLRFAADKGFPWDQVCSVVQFAVEFLATATDKRITDAVQLYQAQSANLILALGERNYKAYTDFLFSTFFCHFQLYKYVLDHPRSQNIPNVIIDVHPPVPPMPLTQSKEVSVWCYEQTLDSLHQEELELTRKRLHHQEDSANLHLTRKEVLDSRVDTTGAPFTKESLAEMMRSLLTDYAAAAGKVMTTNIQDVQQDLEIKLQKTCVPRPAPLGPPPRYKLRSPIQPLPKSGCTPGKGDKKNKNNSSLDKPKSPKSRKSSARSHTASSRGSRR